MVIMYRFKMSRSETVGKIIIYLFLLFVVMICLLPFVYIASVSISSDKAIALYGGTLVPRDLSLAAYKFVFKYGNRVLHAYKSTLFITVVGTFIGVMVTAGVAYPLSKKNLPFRTPFMMYVLFSMLFSGGLIPLYLVVTKLGLFNSYFAVILPMCYSSWNMILMRNFFNTIPDSLEESALIDGANEIHIFFKIMLPLSKPILATIALFLAVTFWNSWFQALIFLKDVKKWPLMLFLKEVIQSSRPSDKVVDLSRSSYPPSESLKMAVVMVCTLPILFAYPFAQKYFVHGIMIGSIKG